MGNLGSLITVLLTIFLVPWAIGRMPYFRRPNVVARRAAKAQLPGWVRLAELFFFCISEVSLAVLLFSVEMKTHRALHQGANILPYAPQVASANFVFWVIQILAPLIMVIPLGLLLANSMSWLIAPIRNIENKIMAQGAAGYTWHDLNYGLIKFSLVASSVCIILMAISLPRV